MKNISIDIETFSDIDLNKCGVYRYAESSAFEILLFGYAVDCGEVTVIDLAQGEKIPEVILDALTDDSVTKWAFNANFERICLSRYLRDLGRNLDLFHDNHPLPTKNTMYLNPVGWHCSMVRAATMGLPLSLKDVGSILKLKEQKMDEGKALIRYFSVPCSPTKSNGGRTRNLPSDDPEKWKAFKAYNRRDVEAEMAIQEKLSGFPVSDAVWDKYNIDREINDRGVRVDMQLVNNAIDMDGRSRKELTAAMRKIIRTAFILKKNHKLYVADFSAIEARAITRYAGEKWRQEVFKKGGDIYCASASRMFRVPVEKHGVNGHLRQKGKIAKLALGYGGLVGALKSMGALEMGLSEDELQSLVSARRQTNPHIVKFRWDVDRAVTDAVKYKRTSHSYGLTFSCKSGMLMITLPSGRNLVYVKPKIGTNRFGGQCINYEGVGSTKKWERIDSYGPKLVENIVRATSRDILCNSMNTLRCCSIVMHIHDELVIEADPKVSLDVLCEQMGRVPDRTPGLNLRADGYICDFYMKD